MNVYNIAGGESADFNGDDITGRGSVDVNDMMSLGEGQLT